MQFNARQCDVFFFSRLVGKDLLDQDKFFDELVDRGKFRLLFWKILNLSIPFIPIWKIGFQAFWQIHILSQYWSLILKEFQAVLLRLLDDILRRLKQQTQEVIIGTLMISIYYWIYGLIQPEKKFFFSLKNLRSLRCKK